MDLKEKAIKLIDRCPIGMLGNTDANGNPKIKAMIKTKNDGLREFWFCSNTSSKRVSELKEDGNACLYFYEFDTSDGMICRGLMLSGTVEISYDDDIRRSFWQDGMEIYYPQGPLDPDFALIRFTAVRCNYYEGLVNTDFEV